MNYLKTMLSVGPLNTRARITPSRVYMWEEFDIVAHDDNEQFVRESHREETIQFV